MHLRSGSLMHLRSGSSDSACQMSEMRDQSDLWGREGEEMMKDPAAMEAEEKVRD
jgi:hypothetical protein